MFGLAPALSGHGEIPHPALAPEKERPSIMFVKVLLDYFEAVRTGTSPCGVKAWRLRVAQGTPIDVRSNVHSDSMVSTEPVALAMGTVSAPRIHNSTLSFLEIRLFNQLPDPCTFLVFEQVNPTASFLVVHSISYHQGDRENLRSHFDSTINIVFGQHCWLYACQWYDEVLLLWESRRW
jgi:hypothetical protein